MSIKLNACDCLWSEQPNQGQVKGYTLVTECEVCRVKREQANADREAADLKAKEAKEVEDLIEAKKREIAVRELKTEGKLDQAGKIVKEK